MSARRLALVAAGVPFAAAAVLAAQILYAANRDRPDLDLSEDVSATVGPAGGEPLHLVVLGDSTAAGVGARSVEGTMPVLVAERVAAALDRPVSVRGHGVSGARTGDTRTEQVPVLHRAPADVVLIAVGSNDVTHLTPPWTLRRQTTALLAQARDAAGGAPVVLAGIPLFNGVEAIPQPLRSVVIAYARVLREAQRDATDATDDADGARYVDIAREASPRFADVPDAMSADDYHPSAVGYGFWADAIAPAVSDAARDAP